MKKILFVLLIIIVALAGSTYYFGMKAEKQYEEIIAKIKESGNITVKKKTYERGFFNSKARTSLEIKNSSKSFTINSEDNITHGPLDILAIPKGKLNFSPFIAKADSSVTINIPVTTDDGKAKTLSIKSAGNTDVNFSGTAESNYVIPKYKIIKKSEDLVFDWSGLQMNFLYDAKTNHLNSSLVSKSLNVTDPDSSFSISNITVTSSSDDIKKNLQSLSGNFEMKIQNVKFKSEGEKADMSNLKFSGFSKEKQGKLSMGIKMVGDKLVTNDYEFGPLVYDFALRDIDSAAWIKLHDKANEMKGTENAMEQGMQLMGILPELVKHSPIIEIKELSLKSSLGDFNANAVVKVKGDNPEMLQNILLIGNTLEAEASVVASKSLVDFYIQNTTKTTNKAKKLPDNNVSQGAENLLEGEVFIPGELKNDLAETNKKSGIEGLIDSGYLVPDGDNYKLNATLKAGQVSVNGKPVPLAQMMLQ